VCRGRKTRHPNAVSATITQAIEITHTWRCRQQCALSMFGAKDFPTVAYMPVSACTSVATRSLDPSTPAAVSGDVCGYHAEPQPAPWLLGRGAVGEVGEFFWVNLLLGESPQDRAGHAGDIDICVLKNLPDARGVLRDLRTSCLRMRVRSRCQVYRLASPNLSLTKIFFTESPGTSTAMAGRSGACCHVCS
jgi:hypothetical protein